MDLFHYWTQYWYALPLAIGVSTMAMSSGVGGGLIFAPFFLLVLKLTPGQALGTSLVTEVFGMGTGFFNYYRLKLIDFKTGLILLAASVPGALLGALLINLNLVNVFYLKLVFGIVILFMAFMMLFQNVLSKKGVKTEGNVKVKKLIDAKGNEYTYSITGIAKMVITSFVAGIGVGTVAIGSGELNTPRLIASGVPSKVAVPTSVFVMAVTVFSATFIYILNGQPLVPLAIYTCSGVLIGAKLGTILISKVSETLIKRVLFVLFLLVGLFILATNFLLK